MYRYVIFDLDGTLLDTLDDLADAGNWVCTVNGWPTFTREQYKTMVGNGVPKLCERFSPADARTPELLAGTLAQFSARYAAHKADKTQPYAGIPELLTSLRRAQVGCAVFSNKTDCLVQDIVKNYFGDVFLVARGNQPGMPHKPAPDGLFPILKAMGAAPAETLYVGDSDVDILTAKNAGLDSCGVLWGFRSAEELTRAGATYLAADADQLLHTILD